MEYLGWTVLFAACVNGVASEVTMPSHAQIAQAVAETGNREFASWTESPESYILRPSPKVQLQHHQLWFVIPSDVPHPMSFYVAADATGAVVTTGNAVGIDRLLADEPALRDQEAIGPAVFELVRQQGRPWALQGTPRVERTNGQIDVWLPVTDGRSQETWQVHLAGAKSTFVREGAP